VSPTKSNGISPKVNTFRALEYYICRPGCCANEVAKALIRAAARGVSCRVLVAHGYWKHADAVLKLVHLGKLLKQKCRAWSIHHHARHNLCQPGTFPDKKSCHQWISADVSLEREQFAFGTAHRGSIPRKGRGCIFYRPSVPSIFKHFPYPW